MGEIAINYSIVPAIADRIAKVLIEESAALNGALNQVEWIEREVRLMHAFLEHREREYPGWSEILNHTARDAMDVIETFLIKSVKKKRRGVLYLFDKSKFIKELERINIQVRKISQIRIINTLRSTTEASVINLKTWEDEYSLNFFTRNLKVEISSQVIKFGKEIVIKCGGIPSEIKKMSDLLSHVRVEEWSSVIKQYNQDQQTWFLLCNIIHKINTDLPLHLRRCLYYLLEFPAEFAIPTRRLIPLWVAEGLVHHEEEHPEQVAEKYLINLIDMNMIQVAKRKANGKVKTCRIPIPLRELWLKKANESRILLQGQATIDLDAAPKSLIIRRLRDHLDENDIWHNHIHGHTRIASASLRTYYKDVLSFLSFDVRDQARRQDIGNFLKRCIGKNCFLLLQVLDLERVSTPNLPKSISKLSRLRYLGLRWTKLESLPSSISSLLKLQTLDLKHTHINIATSSIWKIQLRHLYLTADDSRSRFPSQAKDNSLSDLQTLWGLFVDEDTPVKGGLDKLVNIKKLKLIFQPTSSQQQGAMISQLDAVAGWITKLKYLQSLTLRSTDDKLQPWKLRLKSLENHTNLTDLFLAGSLSSSSTLSQFPPSLVQLTLSQTKLQDDPMQILKNLPNLRSLSLFPQSYTGQTLVCESQSFPELHVLNLRVLEQLEDWKIEEKALPRLTQLEIRRCLRLKMLPDGLKNVSSLLELKLTNMPMEINTDKHRIPPNCEVFRDNPPYDCIIVCEQQSFCEKLF